MPPTTQPSPDRSDLGLAPGLKLHPGLPAVEKPAVSKIVVPFHLELVNEGGFKELAEAVLGQRQVNLSGQAIEVIVPG